MLRSMIARLALLLLPLAPPAAAADEVADEKARLDEAMGRLVEAAPIVERLRDEAAGMLLLPNVTRAGLLLGGAYGEGVLLVGGEPAGGYAVADASIDFEVGAKVTTEALFFMTAAALARFRRGEAWIAGESGEVALVDEDGVAPENEPIVGVVVWRGAPVEADIDGALYSPLGPD